MNYFYFFSKLHTTRINSEREKANENAYPACVEETKMILIFSGSAQMPLSALADPPVSPNSLNRFMVPHYLIFRHKQIVP